jgi:hypothetical protein
MPKRLAGAVSQRRHQHEGEPTDDTMRKPNLPGEQCGKNRHAEEEQQKGESHSDLAKHMHASSSFWAEVEFPGSLRPLRLVEAMARARRPDRGAVEHSCRLSASEAATMLFPANVVDPLENTLCLVARGLAVVFVGDLREIGYEISDLGVGHLPQCRGDCAFLPSSLDLSKPGSDGFTFYFFWQAARCQARLFRGI